MAGTITVSSGPYVPSRLGRPRGTFQKHTKTILPGQECTECGLVLPNRSTLERHLISAHNVTDALTVQKAALDRCLLAPKFQCTDCSQLFDTLKLLSEHRDLKHQHPSPALLPMPALTRAPAVKLKLEPQTIQNGQQRSLICDVRREDKPRAKPPPSLVKVKAEPPDDDGFSDLTHKSDFDNVTAEQSPVRVGVLPTRKDQPTECPPVCVCDPQSKNQRAPRILKRKKKPCICGAECNEKQPAVVSAPPSKARKSIKSKVAIANNVTKQRDDNSILVDTSAPAKVVVPYRAYRLSSDDPFLRQYRSSIERSLTTVSKPTDNEPKPRRRRQRSHRCSAGNEPWRLAMKDSSECSYKTGDVTEPTAPDSKDNMWPCPLCIKRFISQAKLRQHLAFHRRAKDM